MKFNLPQVAAVATLSLAAAGFAFTVHADDEALGLAEARISLVEAVTAAEQHVGGKAFQAEYEREKGQWVFEVAVVKDQQVMDVKVDSMTGKVLSAIEDKPD